MTNSDESAESARGPATRRRRALGRRTKVILASVVAVALVGVGVTAWMLSRPESATGAAQRYLSALENGDVDVVLGFLPDTADRDQLIALFSGAVGRIADASITDAAEHEGDVDITAAVTIDDSPGVVSFTLSSSDGQWTLTSGYTNAVEVATTVGDSVAVGEVVTPVDTALPLLPAVYVIAAAPTSVLDGEVRVAVTSDELTPVIIDASLSPGATAAAQEQIDVYADACTVPASAVPDTCGLRVPWAADLATLSSITFRVEQRPIVELDAATSSFAATGGVVVATAEGITREGGDASFTYRADDWALRGAMVFSGNEMSLRVF